MLSQSLSLEEACQALLDGQVIIFPTETFYGIGCNAMNPDAVGSVFSIKKRDLDLPLPVVVAGKEQVEALSYSISDTALKLMESFWPGPLSIVLPAREEVPDLLTANAARVAVRCSPHPAVIALCETSGLLLVASSANISGNPPAESPEDLDQGLLEKVAGVFVAGPPPAGGQPSTVVDVGVSRKGEEVVRILRKGVISEEELRDAGFEIFLCNEETC